MTLEPLSQRASCEEEAPCSENRISWLAPETVGEERISWLAPEPPVKISEPPPSPSPELLQSTRSVFQEARREFTRMLELFAMVAKH